MTFYFLRTILLHGQDEYIRVSARGFEVGPKWCPAIATAAAQSLWGDVQDFRTVIENTDMCVYEVSTPRHGGFIAITKKPLAAHFDEFRLLHMEVREVLELAPHVYAFEEDCDWAFLEPLIGDDAWADNIRKSGRKCTVSELRQVAARTRAWKANYQQKTK